MAKIILVHGAWHGGWCWFRTHPELSKLGHDAEAIDLPAHGDDGADIRTVTLADYVDRVATAVQAQPIDTPVILVGHSMGGLVISQVAERVGPRLTGLIYLCAMLSEPGQPAPPISPDSPLRAARRFSDDGLTWTIDPAALKPVFYADCDDNDVALATRRLVPETTQLSPPALPGEIQHWHTIPRAYITCRDDHAVPLAQQRQMIEQHGVDHIIDMPTSQSPFFSAPKHLARHISNLVQLMIDDRHTNLPPG